jgi:hypothetical protein
MPERTNPRTSPEKKKKPGTFAFAQEPTTLPNAFAKFQHNSRSPPSKKEKGKCCYDRDRSWRVGWVLAFSVFVSGIAEHCRQYS